MFGCHNCGKRPEKNAVYEKTPCARCRTKQDPALISCHSEDAASAWQQYQTMHPAYEKLNDGSPEYQMMQGVIAALSQTLGFLIQLKEKNPETFRVVEAKMHNPLFSYSQLAEQLNCRKQNILYHLKKAMRLCPEIGFALIIDPRFSRGQHIKPRFRKLYEQLGLDELEN